MAGYDRNQVAALLRQIGQADQPLSAAYVDGTISATSDSDSQLRALHKAKLLRPEEDLGDYRIATDLKRLLNKLLRHQSSYRQLTDMGKVIEAMEEAVDDYRDSYLNNQLDDAEHYLDQFDDLAYEARDSLTTSLDNMHYAISSQFGFVATLGAKVRENQKALDYAQKLLNELQQIDPAICYDWIFEAAPTELARKITGFIRWYRDALQRLAHTIDKMRQSLFRLRRQVKQANQLKGMARYLRQHPEYQLPEDLHLDAALPQPLKLSPKLAMGGLPDVRSSTQEDDLVGIVQHLRKLSQAQPDQRGREGVAVEDQPLEILGYISDWALDEVERYFELALAQTELSALAYWQQQQPSWAEKDQQLEPQMWIELVFGYYCNLSITMQQAIDLQLQEALKDGTNNNFTYSDVTVRFRAAS
ncbi:hypothetical protein [uncultured Ferrimonas sp.]|uniref:hypothetical protein n=1 Tax=uncultured Ferrimonas sp. TaxID=432640 RepID=UPI0026140828|nr:hypothetical protein [uncultured Ferrimonas sp.]